MKVEKVAIIGMGYVGLTASVTFAKHGFESICTTTTQSKAENLNRVTGICMILPCAKQKKKLVLMTAGYRFLES